MLEAYNLCCVLSIKVMSWCSEYPFPHNKLWLQFEKCLCSFKTDKDHRFNPWWIQLKDLKMVFSQSSLSKPHCQVRVRWWDIYICQRNNNTPQRLMWRRKHRHCSFTNVVCSDWNKKKRNEARFLECDCFCNVTDWGTVKGHNFVASNVSKQFCVRI